VTFRRILKPINPFDVDYSSKKFYDWKVAAIADTPEETLMLKEKPQEAAYRMGVRLLLLEKYEEAIRSLSEAIGMKPEDARFYLFRGMAYALQSCKGGLLGSSRGSEELGKSESESDLARALELSKGNESLEHVCLRTKHSLIAYEDDLARRRAKRVRALRSAPWSLVGAIASVFGFGLGLIWTIIGIGQFVTYASSAQLVNMTNGLSFVLCGVIELLGVFSIHKEKRKLGALLVFVGILVLYLLIT
jgi:tetratricopeptide (TPR) repeat protein